MAPKEAERCALCGRRLRLDRNKLAVEMGKALEEIRDIKTVICGPCTKSEKYRSDFFEKVPHISLNIAAE